MRRFWGNLNLHAAMNGDHCNTVVSGSNISSDDISLITSPTSLARMSPGLIIPDDDFFFRSEIEKAHLLRAAALAAAEGKVRFPKLQV